MNSQAQSQLLGDSHGLISFWSQLNPFWNLYEILRAILSPLSHLQFMEPVALV